MAEDAETARAATESSARPRTGGHWPLLEFAKERRKADYLSVRSGSPVESLKAAAELQKIPGDLPVGKPRRSVSTRRRPRHSQSGSPDRVARQAVAALRTIRRRPSCCGAPARRTGKQRLKAPISGQLADVSPLRIGAYVAEGAETRDHPAHRRIDDRRRIRPIGRSAVSQQDNPRNRLTASLGTIWRDNCARDQRRRREIRDGLVRGNFLVVSCSAYRHPSPAWIAQQQRLK